MAQLQIPQGYRWAGRDDSRLLMESWLNPDPKFSGVVTAEVGDLSFLVAFRFMPEGYVPDTEKDQLVPDAILGAINEATAIDNAVRRAKGWPVIDNVKWEKSPFYDPRTNNLTWSIRFESSGRPGLNHDVRLLGRSGYMQVKLIATPDQIVAIVPFMNSLLNGLTFNSGQEYKDYVIGDKRAPYGLVAMVAGTSATFAAKSGLLGRPYPRAGGLAPKGSSPSPQPGSLLSARSPFSTITQESARTSSSLLSRQHRIMPPQRSFSQGPEQLTYHAPPRVSTPVMGRTNVGTRNNLAKGLFAAIVAAIVGAFSWLGKQLGRNRKDSSGST